MDPRQEDTQCDPASDPPDRFEAWLIDGFNLLHTVILGGRDRSGWWRPEYRRAVLETVAGFDGGAATVQVVFDGSKPPDEPDGRDPAAPDVEVAFAPSADDWILKQVRGAERPGAFVVVTADRQLGDRCRHAGATILHPRHFAARCRNPQGE